VSTFASLTERIRMHASEWETLGQLDLLYDNRSGALTFLSIVIGAALLMLTLRALRGSTPSRDRVVLPALFAARWTPAPAVRHLPTLLFLAGLPPLALALADPYTTTANRQVSYPGRRIALMIDASSSMLKPFADPQIELEGPLRSRAAFFSTVSAAEVFIKQRRQGQYRDVIGLIEFGDEAYVITPFTNDFDNVLLSTSLIGDWSEFMRFPNQGTKIAAAIQEGVRLFETFDFLDASGNLMLIFSDGEDTQLTLQGRHVDDILRSAVTNRIPVYFIRTNRDKQLGEVVPDSIWKPAVESTGGRFYPAANERDVLRAIEDIDRRSPGTIEMTVYSTNERRFAPFALLAALLWSAAAVLKLSMAAFRTFP
jgi:hypothetical protein